MAVTDDKVKDILEENNFQITNVEQISPEMTKLTVIHNLHPEEEIQIDIVSRVEDGEEVMEMQFTGPDVWTDEEAKQVLQEVMDTLVKVIEKGLEEEPVIPETMTNTENNNLEENNGN